MNNYIKFNYDYYNSQLLRSKSQFYLYSLEYRFIISLERTQTKKNNYKFDNLSYNIWKLDGNGNIVGRTSKVKIY